MMLRLLSLALALFVLCGALQGSELTASSSFDRPAAVAAPTPALQDAGSTYPTDFLQAQWQAEAGGDPQELLCARPDEPPAPRARNGYGPFVRPVLRTPYLGGLLRPPCPARPTVA